MGKDCLVIGYYEPPFEHYERVIRQYGTDSEAYRDLQFSFVDVGNRKLDYVALLNQAYVGAHPDRPKLDPFKSGDIPNLAAVYLAHYLRQSGFDADYINLFTYELDRLEALLREQPRCVAITTTFYVLNMPVIEMVNWIRERNANVPIVVGGPLVANHARNHATVDVPIVRGQRPTLASYAPNDTMLVALEDMGADIYVIESQGEQTLAKVVRCLRDGGSLSTVPNIAYRDGGEFRVNPAEPESNPLDDHAIDWTMFSDRSLGRTIQTRTARSCAFNCSFCNYPTRAGKLALSSVDTIRRELDSIRRVGDVANVVFIDDTFNVPLPRFKDICRMLIAERFGFNWFSYFRCSNADEEAIALAAESGCKGVFLGVESGSPTILKHMNKAATIEKYGEGIRLLRQHGVLTFGSFITGFPGETAETVEETIDFLREHRPDYYRSQLWYCEPGTPIQGQRATFGIDGRGFVWRHATMDSTEAMDHIERMFFTIDGSTWLPQWSFDFWIIPYLLGKGLSTATFKQFMTMANGLLSLELTGLQPAEKARRQQPYLTGMQKALRDTPVPAASSAASAASSTVS
jgi:radical SAM PhpK family P-methyltransferase